MALEDITPIIKTDYRHVKWVDDKDKASDKTLNVGVNEWVEGHVVHYDPDSGGWDFDQNVVGHLLLRTSADEPLAKITLDKKRLIDSLKTCIDDPRYSEGIRGAFLRITYQGWLQPKNPTARKYKGFRVQHDFEQLDTELRGSSRPAGF